MSKKLIISLIMLFLTLCALIYVVFFLNREDIKYPQLSNKRLITSAPLDATLSIQPNPTIFTASASTSVNVLVETNSSPTVIQLEIAFDPGDLYGFNILPGGYFIDPHILLEKIDYRNGRISYAVGGKSINPNSNIVAGIYFISFNSGVAKQSALQFLPKTSIKQDAKMINLKKAKDLDIIIKPSFVPISTPSAQPTP
ncbi:MAG TPA: hypothetical protein VM077_05235 [Candidatus Limnocylindrales bacterium]|nr:hypothetical protein [Candidatus Limnocylindrales bacterium]